MENLIYFIFTMNITSIILIMLILYRKRKIELKLSSVIQTTENKFDIVIDKVSELDKSIKDHDFLAMLDADEEEFDSSETNTADDYRVTAGRIFECYIADKFNRKYYEFINWTSDKRSSNGMYSKSSHNPDILIKLKSYNKLFAVECKWKKSFYKNGIQFCEDRKLTNYRNYKLENRIPVYVVCGIGGAPDNPAELFLIPIDKIVNCYMDIKDLVNFKLLFFNKEFYFDADLNSLGIKHY